MNELEFLNSTIPVSSASSYGHPDANFIPGQYNAMRYGMEGSVMTTIPTLGDSIPAVPKRTESTRAQRSKTVSADVQNLGSLDEDSEPTNSKQRNKRGPYYSAEVLADGYHYRKYGQKFSRSSPYPTCYYKCAHPGCPVKRQISRSTDGKIVNTYRGTHSHVPPQVRRVEVTTQEEFLAVVREESKFLGEWDDEATEPGKASSEKRLVVVANSSSIDITDDSFAWKKYGSKVVKASTIQKSYYRCATANCSAKRLIQRPAAGGEGESTVTYQGPHNHAVLPREPKAKVTQTISQAVEQDIPSQAPQVANDASSHAQPQHAALPGHGPGPAVIAMPPSTLASDIAPVRLMVPPPNQDPRGHVAGVLATGQRMFTLPSEQGMGSAMLFSTGLGSIWDQHQGPQLDVRRDFMTAGIGSIPTIHSPGFM
ncbi:WRKY DNA -binding domain [Carpediemonas membranifera]|uniref:WRKY DNA -binding domain n=1 Tax=Carpediemonas membranifera TaxID=201153 RepID=A0A8J6AZL0_9EUKA|nr:WRKY DNA -binding domain [Carpediemonas membranifera]|eukprot:KAG9396140.1 WRKY DNA -binding domain [Carpediemonas membranifera]